MLVALDSGMLNWECIDFKTVAGFSKISFSSLPWWFPLFTEISPVLVEVKVVV